MRKKSREEKIETRRLYVKNHREEIRHNQIEWKKSNRFKVILHNVRNRCSNPNNHSYKYYGARGISCLLKEEDIKFLWLRDKASAMNKPTIDRIDNDGDYSCKNCRFVELVQNCVRRRYGWKK